ncbi:MAG: Sec-independent protein translocase protein TatB [Chromatiales bacterium]|jgi:sec-independent protein translocase protein TatB
MFDVGFWELVIIGVVALLVIGPERLPGLARTAGKWIARARRFLGSVKSDIERELKADELRRILEEQQKTNPLDEIIEDSNEALRDIKKGAERVKSQAEGDAAAATGKASPDKTHGEE